MSLNILFWNARGVANTPTQNVAKRLIRLHNVTFLAILEPFTQPNPGFFSRVLGLDFKGMNLNGKIWIFAEQGATFETIVDTEQGSSWTADIPEHGSAYLHLGGLCKMCKG